MKSAHPMVKPIKMEVSDPDVMVDGRPDGSALVRISGGAVFNRGVGHADQARQGRPQEDR